MAIIYEAPISTNLCSNSMILSLNSRLAVDKASDPKIPAQFGSKSAKAANSEAASLAFWQVAALGRALFPDENKAMETQGKGLEPALSCGSLEEAPEETEAHGTCAVARGPKPSARGSPSARRRVRLAMAKEAKTKREAAAAERDRPSWFGGSA